MIYFNHSVGGAGSGGSMRPTFGLRVQQVHQLANNGDPEQGQSMQHRELINWQFDGHSNLRLSQSRVKLGNRLTYDFASSRFGSPSRWVMEIGTPSLRAAAASPVGARSPIGARPFAAPVPMGEGLHARGFAPIGPGRESSGDTSSMHEIAAAAVAALAPARFTAAQRQITRQQMGVTGIARAQRMQSVTAQR